MFRGLLLLLAFGGLAARAAEPAVPILTYHRFDPVQARASTVVVTAVFAEQMAWLEANHYRVVPLRDVVEHRPIDGPAVAITADDGFRTVFTEMFPIIARARMPITLFINPPMIGGGGAYLTWAQIATMRASGLVDIEPHTLTHPDFDSARKRLDPAALRAFETSEIAGSREAIRARLGVAADLLAWPYGIHDGELEAVAREAGYVAAFALGSRAAEAGGDAFAIPRYQVYNTDLGTKFAAIAEGRPRGRR